MRLSRRPVRWVSGWMVAVLLFAQLATAAYACPALARDAAPMATMPGCDGHMSMPMDPDQPQLCQAHCQQGSQNVHPTPTVDAPVVPLLAGLLDWSEPALEPSSCASATPEFRAGASPPGAPPLYLSLLVLRN